ncbi:MAG TPA: ROK family protein [Clostridia bacterium]|nr:ROK family protein [Clostridia bacterium]
MSCVVGLDLGGTNIKGLAVSPGGKVLAETMTPTGDCGTPAWTKNVREALRALRSTLRHEPDLIGLAAPGLPSRDQRSIACMPGRLPGLENLIWQEFFGVSHLVPVLNDAQAALLGEVWRGAAKGAHNVVLLTLGTGVGGAAMVDGHLLRGHIGRAGHLGHISLDPRGAPDVTGTPGSLENAIGDCTVQARSGGRFRSTRDLVAAVRKKDKEAREVWLNSVRSLAAGMASLINVLDPEVIILGGGITQAGVALFRPLRDFLQEFEWRPGGSKVRLVSAKLGDRAGAFGVAWNAMQVNGFKLNQT